MLTLLQTSQCMLDAVAWCTCKHYKVIRLCHNSDIVKTLWCCRSYLNPGIPEKIAVVIKAIPGSHYNFLTWTGGWIWLEAPYRYHVLRTVSKRWNCVPNWAKIAPTKVMPGILPGWHDWKETVRRSEGCAKRKGGVNEDVLSLVLVCEQTDTHCGLVKRIQSDTVDRPEVCKAFCWFMCEKTMKVEEFSGSGRHHVDPGHFRSYLSPANFLVAAVQLVSFEKLCWKKDVADRPTILHELFEIFTVC